jgi:hypothetical protein
MQRIHLLICVLAAFCAAPVIANETVTPKLSPHQSVPDLSFTAGGFGSGVASGFGAPAFYGAFAFSVKGDKLVTVRTVYVSEIDMVGLGHPTPLQSSWDLGLLYGVRTHNQGNFLGTASIGLAVVTHVRRGDYLGAEQMWLFADTYYEKKNTTTVGIPIEVQAILSPTSSFGLGLIVFGDINPTSSLWGVTFSLFAGNLR